MPTDVLAIAREIADGPILDTSDGSRSWYEMNHEEGVLIGADGSILLRVRARPEEPDAVRFPVSLLLKAVDGGAVIHSHTFPYGASFSASDLVPLLCWSRSEVGGVAVVTTSHVIDGSRRRVRYIVDTRGRPELPVSVTNLELAAMWNDHERVVWYRFRNYFDDPDEVGSIYALTLHEIVARLCASLGVRYHREVLP